MDVRCEKCLTVYELDDAKVGDAGLTVKCQECGNLFKVRRRHDTAELAISSPQMDAATPTVDNSRGSRAAAAPASRQDDRQDDRQEDRGWMLRLASSGEVRRFRELTTLQQWIVERKVSRQDSISRGGESWKQLGGIAELASFFHVVEQAEAVARASQPGLAISRTAAQTEKDLPFMRTEILPRNGGDEESTKKTATPAGFGGPAGFAEETLVEASPQASERPARRKSSAGPFLLGTVFAAAVVGGGYLLMRHAESTREEGPSLAAASEARELAQRGRAAFLTDTDDGFRQAISALDRSLELDPSSVAARAVRVDLAETHVTWAAYLLEDARRLEQSGGPAVVQATTKTLKAEAQAHLERARRVLEEPSGADATAAAPTLARAFGDLLRVEGGPAAAAERYFQQAPPGADNPELIYSEAELALREGQTKQAVDKLGEAVRLSKAAGAPLVRAHFRLLAIAQQAGQADEAQRQCDLILAASPKHERARALCTAPTVAQPSSPVAAAPDLGAAKVAVAPKPVHEKEPSAESLAPVVKEPDYKGLIREADRLSENGRSQQARKLYERALALDPKGVAALTGLGYCDLDGERYMQAVDRFNAALSVDPSAGDALMGLAESYKVRGQAPRAIEQYKRYLAANPSGAKASMARKNIADLEAKLAKNAEPKDDDKPEPAKEKPKARETGDTTKDRDEPSLPRPPAEEPP